MKTNKNNNAFDIDQKLYLVQEELLNIDPYSSADSLVKIQQSIEEIAEEYKSEKTHCKYIGYLLVFCSFAAALLLFLLLNNQRYTTQLEHRLDEKVTQYKNQDSLFNKYLGVDSSGNYSTTIIQGKTQSYRDLTARNDTLVSANAKFKDSVSSLNQKLRMAREVYGIKFSERKIGQISYISIKSDLIDEILSSKENAKKYTEKEVKNGNRKTGDTIK